MAYAPKLLPHDVKQAVIDVCGRAFWYKQPLLDVFARAGVPEDVYMRYEDEPKFKIARNVLGDLERQGDEGYLIQRRLVTELCKFRGIPDPDVPDKDAGIDALRSLKESVKSHDFELETGRTTAARTASSRGTMAKREQNRSQRLSELRKRFVGMTQATDAQRRGYDLEDLLKELFALYEIQYKKAFRTDTEQIDGFFHYGGFDYVVEARWRAEKFSKNDLRVFKGKVDHKIESTRGLVVSITGFQDEIARHIRDTGPANVIFFDGYDLALVLEGRVRLTDALQRKIDKAAQEGVMYFSLAKIFENTRTTGIDR